ncbi:hypothetical protein G6F22_021651 [Rhizopus arrhizus]|nr:hypothetical protein G6F22_021651 [Rhizopus arrhizus]
MGRTSRGVTTITNSVSSCVESRLRKNDPMIGKSPSKGTLLTIALVWRDTSPLITKLSPSPNSTVASARRVRSAGMIELESVPLLSTMPLL